MWLVVCLGFELLMSLKSFLQTMFCVVSYWTKASIYSHLIFDEFYFGCWLECISVDIVRKEKRATDCIFCVIHPSVALFFIHV